MPIGHVTNGIHVPTWDSQASDELWTRHCGKERWLGETDRVEEAIRRVPDQELWAMRQASRHALVDYAPQPLCPPPGRIRGAPRRISPGPEQILDPEALTLGFARRFATYKRPTLLLHDPERLIRLLTDPQRPVQLLIAGKAHPADRDWARYDSSMGAIHPAS